MDNQHVFKYLKWIPHLGLNGLTIYLVISLWDRFLLNPTVTSIESSTYPVKLVPFPGISLCNLNKINKYRAEQLAKEIVRRSGRNFSSIMHRLKYIGYLIDFQLPEIEQNDALEFQSLLDKLGYKTIPLIKHLATPCEELLQTCWWQNQLIACAEIFQMRLTFEGYCCLFNYVKRENAIDQYDGTPLSTDSGIENGLSVTIKNDIDNYYYNSISSMGINMHIFVPTDYPDKSSGSLIEDVMSYPIDKRQCLFDVEQQTKFGIYSPSDCFVDCRIRSIMVLCQCVPYRIPLSTDESVCTLSDLPCLNRYRTKWQGQAPFEDVANYFNEEKESSLNCQPCYPGCDSTLYTATADSSPLIPKRNETILHFFYGKRHHELYKQDVVYYWFEILSNFGGIFGVIVGASLVSLTEKIYHFVKIVLHKYHLCGRNQDDF